MEDLLLKALMALLTFTCVLLGMMYRKMDSRVGKLEDNQTVIITDLPTNYVSKAEHRRATDIISENQTVSYSRLESAQLRMEENFRRELEKQDIKLDRIYEELKGKVDK
jgi:hypothetical protein